MKARQWSLASALVATLVASLWAAQQDDDAQPAKSSPAKHDRVAVTQASRARPTIDPGPAAVRLPELPHTSGRAPLAGEAAAFVAPLSFRPPRPPPPSPPRPTAPPLPFRYIGAILDEDGRRALLLEGEQLRFVQRGDEIGGGYRVEHIDESRIDFLFLPLKQRQSMFLPRS